MFRPLEIGRELPKLLDAAFGGNKGRRAAFAMFDLSGSSTNRIVENPIPKRQVTSQADDWRNIGKDFHAAIEQIDILQELNRAAK